METNKRFNFISIIMAAYNAEKTIEKAICSVLNQTYKNFELLIVDDCSTDGTVNVIKECQKTDERIILFENTVNQGVSFARKRGLENARGEWIAILDSDDMWRNDKLEKQISLQKAKDADLIYTGSAFMEEKGKKIGWYLNVPDEISYRNLLKQNLISNSSVLVKKELYLQYYIEKNEIHEDFAIWLNILKSGKIAYAVNEPLLIYRISRASRSGNKLKAAKMNWNTYRYIGLGFLSTLYYECCYMINGIKKYKKIRKNYK